MSGFANLRILDLTDNDIADWRQVLRLGDLPALQRLAIGTLSKIFLMMCLPHPVSHGKLD